MKWHIICLVTITLLAANPIEFVNDLATDYKPSEAQLVITNPVSRQGVDYLFLWTHWQAVMGAYGACPGRVTLCRGGLVWQRIFSLSRKHPTRKKKATVTSESQPNCPNPASTSDEIVDQPATEAKPSDKPASSAAEKESRVSLRMVLEPGIILTKKGIKLRPVIARLGKDVEEYCTLWKDKVNFKVAIESSLHRSCPLCKGKSGFRCIGSARRSVIPPGCKERVRLRVQKIQCRECGAITRILPTFCIPYKSHHAQTIQNVLENCWRRNNSYRDTTGILNQSRPADGKYRGHTLPYEWTIWLGGLVVHLPQCLVWLGFQLVRQGLMDEFFMEQDNGTDNAHTECGAASLLSPSKTPSPPSSGTSCGLIATTRRLSSKRCSN